MRDEFWGQFKLPINITLANAISQVDVTLDGSMMALTSSTSIKLIDSTTLEHKGRIGCSSDIVHSGCFRDDGRLIVSGGDASIVRVFDVSNHSMLRQMTGHSAPVHCAKFSSNRIHVLSASDDKSVRLWDIADGSLVTKLTGATDFVRTASSCATHQQLWLIGSYDNTVRLWDVRTRTYSCTMNHGSAVESVLLLQAANLAVSVGGENVCLWDMAAGAKMVRKFTDRSRTLTCAQATGGDQSHLRPYILTGTLGGNVKIFRLDDFKVSESWKCPYQILTLSISSDARIAALGTAEGILCLRKHSSLGRGNGTRKQLPCVNARQRAHGERCLEPLKSLQVAQKDPLITRQPTKLTFEHDRWVRRFKYREAFDTAIRSCNPEMVATVLEQLALQKAVKKALTGRSHRSIFPIITFLSKHITSQRYKARFIETIHLLLDLYAPALVRHNGDLDKSLKVMNRLMASEIHRQNEIMKILGLIESILFCTVAQS